MRNAMVAVLVGLAAAAAQPALQREIRCSRLVVTDGQNETVVTPDRLEIKRDGTGIRLSLEPTPAGGLSPQIVLELRGGQWGTQRLMIQAQPEGGSVLWTEATKDGRRWLTAPQSVRLGDIEKFKLRGLEE